MTANAPHKRHRHRGATVEDRRDHELDHEHEAGDEADERAQAAHPPREQQQNGEADREPEHRSAAIEVGKTIGVRLAT
jgi:hypothetical protein